jgi:hypothetical protein
MSKFEELVKQAMAEGCDESCFSEAAKEQVAEHREVMDRYMASNGDAKAHKDDILKALFNRAKSGDYTTRHRTLVEKTASVLKK